MFLARISHFVSQDKPQVSCKTKDVFLCATIMLV